MGEQKAKSFAELGFSDAGAVSDEACVTALSTDSQRVAKGALFFALQGVNTHGAEFIDGVITRGVSGIVTDRRGAQIIAERVGEACAAQGVRVIISDNPRRDLSTAAARFYPLQPDKIVAITGTNAKTSIAHFTRQIWQALGLPAANIGTLGVQGDYDAPLAHTTPDAITLHRLLDGMAGAGVGFAAVEASSHGLQQHRLDGVWLSAAAFSNFSQDHLDYHGDFDSYFKAKARLFADVLPRDGVAVVNINDAKGGAVCDIARGRGQGVLTFGAGGDVELLEQRADADGQDLRFVFMGETHQSRLNLMGAFQADNALMALGLAVASGQEAGASIAQLPALKTVDGRMQMAARRSNGAPVFVDYAHTPDALRHALGSLRQHIMGRLVVVFGAGGDRDKTKRALMGQIAAQFADVAIVTDDNPRGEVAGDIRAMIMRGCPNAQECGDRAEAILKGVAALGAGDALLIAGKGHESGQTIGATTYAFVDAEQASLSVAALDGGA